MSAAARLPRPLKTRVAQLGAILILRVIDASLRIVGYQRTCRWLLTLSRTPSALPSAGDAQRAYALARTIAGMVAVTRVNCVREALAVWWVLRWLGIGTRVCIGINPDGGHAWVEYQGVVLTDSQEIASQFAVLYDDELLPERIGARHSTP
jgi:hypothetical protein